MMNRDLWFRLLQVAVVAPYVYKLSGESKNPYFGVGLKMVAGSIIIMNVKPIVQAAAPLVKLLADAAAAQARQVAVVDRDSAIEGEYVENES